MGARITSSDLEIFVFSDRFCEKRVPLLDYYMTTDTVGSA
nr:hypothetical protein NPLVJFJD_NPLVJFJD_CDS_0008 [Microvirus sp.]